jgi:hypothetical protein
MIPVGQLTASNPQATASLRIEMTQSRSRNGTLSQDGRRSTATCLHWRLQGLRENNALLLRAVSADPRISPPILEIAMNALPRLG